MASSPGGITTTPEEVFRTALSYEHSGHELTASMVRGKVSGAGEGFLQIGVKVGDMPAAFGPSIVCMTFSLELYLKSLIQLEQGTQVPPRGHPIEALFAQVTPNSQARIRHFYDAFMKLNKKGLENTPWVANDPGCLDFDRAMIVTSDAFAKWRYCHERQMAGGGYMTMYFAYAARRTIIEMRPTWELYLAGLTMPATSLTR